MATADVVVVGGGAIGVSCAFELARDGAKVTLLEMKDRLGMGCSYGSAGLISPVLAEPFATPATVRIGLRSLLQRRGPFAVARRPSVVPWLLQVAAESARPRRAAARSSLLLSLILDALQMHRSYADEGIGTTFRSNGILSIYATEVESRRAAVNASQKGSAVQHLLAEEVRARVPNAQSYSAAILLENEAGVDPHQYVLAMGDAAVALRADIRTGVQVLQFDRGLDGSIKTLQTTQGPMHPGSVVLASGAWAARFRGQLGITAPLLPGKGYCVDFARTESDGVIPTYIGDAHILIIPLSDRLRVAGRLDIGETQEAPSWPVVQALEAAGSRYWKGLADRSRLNVWAGLRPCSPDGLPYIGIPAGHRNLCLATGHGMQGLALAPLTGRIVTEVISGRPSTRDLSLLSPDRYDWRQFLHP